MDEASRVEQGPTRTSQAVAQRPNATKLINFMWDEAFQLWDKRNKEIFETKDENNGTLLFDLKQQARELYNLEDKVLARDQSNFALPLNKQLIQHSIQLHNYVKFKDPSFDKVLREQRS
jgi:hypothetical protein